MGELFIKKFLIASSPIWMEEKMGMKKSFSDIEEAKEYLAEIGLVDSETTFVPDADLKVRDEFIFVTATGFEPDFPKFVGNPPKFTLPYFLQVQMNQWIKNQRGFQLKNGKDAIPIVIAPCNHGFALFVLFPTGIPWQL